MRQHLSLLLLSSLCIGLSSHADSGRAAEPPEKVAQRVDAVVHQLWQQSGVTPAMPASDEEFLRRAWLDLAGVAPPASAIRAFAASSDPAKRAGSVDQLLETPLFANHQADHWFNVLLPGDATAGRQDEADELRNWLRRQFAEDTDYDDLVTRFLTAGGPDDAGPAAFYVSLDVQPEKLAAATSKIFLGIQLGCAQCHDHPFESWKQHEFWGYAAFFARLRSDTRNGQVYVQNLMQGDVRYPPTDEIVPATFPGRDSAVDDRLGNRRKQLAIWMTSKANPFFALWGANRTWHHLMGRYLVEPEEFGRAVQQGSSDDFRVQALQILADDFTASDFDIRRLYRVIARTHTYHLTSRDATAVQQRAMAAMVVKTLSPQQFFDTLARNVYRRHGTDELEAQKRQFVARMRSTENDPRQYPHGVVQVLGVMHGPELAAATTGESAGLIRALDMPLLSDADRIEWLFLETLSRFPDPDEQEVFAQTLTQVPRDQRSGIWADMVWALVNSPEFATCP